MCESSDILQIYNAKGEADVIGAIHPTKGGVPYQFERVGFFVADYNTTTGHPIFNLTTALTDSWAAQVDDSSKEAQVHIDNYTGLYSLVVILGKGSS